jgi:hypothetical protein
VKFVLRAGAAVYLGLTLDSPSIPILPSGSNDWGTDVLRRCLDPFFIRVELAAYRIDDHDD